MLVRIALIVCFYAGASWTALFAQLNINSSGGIGLGANAPSTWTGNEKFYMLNATNDRGFRLRTTKNSGGWMRCFVNEIHTTKHSATLLGITNDISKHSGDTKSLYGFANYIKHRGSGTVMGIQNVVYREGSGEKRALYNNVQDDDSATASSTKHIFGVYNYLHAKYRPAAYANYNLLVNSNTDANDKLYGVYVEETGEGSAGTYGIYSKVDDREGSYAGFFEGRMWINGEFTQSSDRRLKKDVKEVTNAMALVRSLRPTSYRFNGRAGRAVDQTTLHYGFLAQELEQVLPDLVSEVRRPARYRYDDDYLVDGDTTAVPRQTEEIAASDTYKGVRYLDLIPILTQAIKEQQLDIDALHGRLAKLTPATPGGGGRASTEVGANFMSNSTTAAEGATEDENEVLRESVAELRQQLEQLRQEVALLRACTDCRTGRTDETSATPSAGRVSIYPNPARDRVTINNPLGAGYEVRVVSADGREYARLTVTGRVAQVDISSWPAGTYVFEILEGDVVVDRQSVVVSR